MKIEQYNGYSVVSRENALEILGEERLRQMERDAILRGGPRGFDGFYSWNVEAAKVKVWKPVATEKLAARCKACGQLLTTLNQTGTG